MTVLVYSRMTSWMSINCSVVCAYT